MDGCVVIVIYMHLLSYSALSTVTAIISLNLFVLLVSRGRVFYLFGEDV